ncbi:MAG: aspartate aminotransferase family protein [Cytophagales bacterium]
MDFGNAELIREETIMPMATDKNLVSKYFHEFVAQTSPLPFEISVDRAEGSYIWDSEGKKYLDFISGIAVNNLGHRHPKIIKALKEQIEKHLFVMVYGEFSIKSQANLAAKLCQLLPDPIDNVYFTSTGTEAVEGALKLAKRYTGRHKIISFKKSYHGSTHGSLSVSGNEYKKFAFRPLLPEVYQIEFNNTEDLDLIDDQTACVIMETVQGDAGLRIPNLCFIQALREKCSECGALLILDEIQVGMGRTGKLFAFEHYGIVPDILVMGKALGAGLPLGAFAASKKIMSSFTQDPVLGHITTFGGNPLSCAASLAFLECLMDEKILDSVEEKGKHLESFLDHPEIVEVRRIGLFFAVEFKDKEAVNKIVLKCRDRGLLSFWFLSCPNAFRLSPPLNISFEEIKKGGEIIRNCIEEVFKN